MESGLTEQRCSLAGRSSTGAWEGCRMQDAESPWLLQIEEVGVGSCHKRERGCCVAWFLKCCEHMVS